MIGIDDERERERGRERGEKEERTPCCQRSLKMVTIIIEDNDDIKYLKTFNCFKDDSY